MENKINWVVDEVRMDYNANVLRANLTGKPEQRPFVGYLNNIHNDLQKAIINGSTLNEPVRAVEMTNLYTKMDIRRQSSIKKVIFNDPATIVIWRDDTKTVVKAVNEPFDPEKGLAMAIAKKAFGNQGNYYNEISRWVDEYQSNKRSCEIKPLTEEQQAQLLKRCRTMSRDLSEAMRKALFPKVSPEARHLVSNAYQVLSEVTSRKRVTKAEMEAAMEVAIGYLGHVLDD